MNLSLNKFSFVGGNNNNIFKFSSNKKFNGTEMISLNNISIFQKKKNTKNTIDISKKNKIDLL